MGKVALLERVSTLIRANLNELIEKAEEPEKLIKQVILDMENQLMQLKTQVAIAIADQHLLEKKQKEYEQKAEEWQKKAEFAVRKNDDRLARAALERKLSLAQMGENFVHQVEDQKTEVENLKSALRKLEAKIEEAKAKADLLVAQHRRARVLTKASRARASASDSGKIGTFDRMKQKVERGEAISKAHAEVLQMDEDACIEEKFALLEREEQIDRLLEELKQKRA